jgi:hypothetical protein
VFRVTSIVVYLVDANPYKVATHGPVVCHGVQTSITQQVVASAQLSASVPKARRVTNGSQPSKSKGASGGVQPPGISMVSIAYPIDPRGRAFTDAATWATYAFAVKTCLLLSNVRAGRYQLRACGLSAAGHVTEAASVVFNAHNDGQRYVGGRPVKRKRQRQPSSPVAASPQASSSSSPPPPPPPLAAIAAIDSKRQRTNTESAVAGQSISALASVAMLEFSR